MGSRAIPRVLSAMNVRPLLYVSLTGLLLSGVIASLSPWVIISAAPIHGDAGYPHLLSNVIWTIAPVAEAVRVEHIAASLAYGAFIMVFAWIVFRVAGSHALPVSIVAASLVFASPFAYSVLLLIDGVDIVLAAIAWLLLIASLIGILRLTPIAEAVLVTAILLADPAFVVPCVAYSIIWGASKPYAYRIGAILFIAAGGALLVHISKWTGAASSAQEASILGIGVLVFVWLPGVLYFAKTAYFQRIGFRRVKLGIPLLLIALGFVVAGAIMPVADASPYWLLSECVLLILLAQSLTERPITTAQAGLIALCVLLAHTWLIFWPARSLEVLDLGRQAPMFADDLARRPVGDVCTTIPSLARFRVLFPSGSRRTFVDFAPEKNVDNCITPRTVGVLTRGQGEFQYWSAGGLSLVRASMTRGQSLLGGRAPEVLPHEPSMLGRQGAFLNSTQGPNAVLPSVTALPGFVATFHCAWRGVGKQLAFAAGNPLQAFPGTAESRLILIARTDGQEHLLGVYNFEPSSGPINWIFRTVHLPSTEACGDVIFTVAAPTGNAKGTWGTVVEPVVE